MGARAAATVVARYFTWKNRVFTPESMKKTVKEASVVLS